jgi:hypothetical protein
MPESTVARAAAEVNARRPAGANLSPHPAIRVRLRSTMRWIDYYAIVATAVTLFLVGWGMLGLRKPGPQRGFGGAQAAIMVTGVMALATLHGTIVSGIALAMSRNPVSWTTAAIHGLIIVATIIRIKLT